MLRSSIGQWLVDFVPWLADYAFVSVVLIHERRLGEQSALAPWLRSSLLPERPDAIALIVRSFLASPGVARLRQGGGERQGKLCATDEHAWGGGGTCEMPGTRGTLWV